MDTEEKNKQIFTIYAALGELSVLRKQTIQKINQIDKRIEDLESQLVSIIKGAKND